MWTRTISAIGAAGLAAAASMFVGSWRWGRATDVLAERMLASAWRDGTRRYHARDAASVPEPVARYFRHVLSDGQPMIAVALAEQFGSFRLRDSEEAWRPFSATQAFITRPPGFVWDARIAMGAGVTVRVRDAFSDGIGSMRAALMGVIPIVDAAATPELASGALHRYLAEAVWFPTALLPGQGVVWTPSGRDSATATLTEGGTTVSLEFCFNDHGEIIESFTPSRFREVDGGYVLTPWGATYDDYAVTSGVRIPRGGEVAWWLDGRRFVYWRGRVTTITYEYQRPVVREHRRGGD